MAKRNKNKDEWGNVFASGNDGESVSLPTDISHEAMAETFVGMGLITPANQKHIQVQYIEIDEIYPDPTQPRRVIPAAVRQDLQVTPGTVTTILKRWLDLVNHSLAERSLDHFPLHDHLMHDSTPRHSAVIEALETADETDAESTPDAFYGVERGFLDLVDLASSIRAQGLINPITVSRRGEGYRIETGERRWLAVHLLHWHFGDGDKNASGEDLKWDKIAARVMDQHNVWRQAVENNARNDLNAIGKARQLAILLMELHGGIGNFTPIDSFDNEQEFYAQVADGNEHRIPRGKGELLAAALNLKNTQQLRDYRALLRIPNEIWTSADDENWSEYTIYEMLRGDSVSSDTVSEKNQLDSVSSDTVYDDDGYPEIDPDVKRVIQLRERLLTRNRWQKMSPEKRLSIYDQVRAFVIMMEELGFDE